ncbi:MAG: type II toxin-antitoxin system RelE/ParE family toxin [Thermomicrobiales bacterium]
MIVHWTETAAAHLVAIYEHIARDSPQYALRMVDRITQRSSQIGSVPSSGRAVPEYDAGDIREVIEGSYRIIYCVRTDRVDVLAVVHGARRLPPTA